MLWRLTSSTKTPWPCSSRRSSLRGMLWPCHGFGAAGASVSTRSGVATSVMAHLLAGRGLDRVDDVPVARAAADVALEALADLLVARPRVRLEQRRRSDEHARRAVAALQRVVVAERLLQRRQLVAVGEALD